MTTVSTLIAPLATPALVYLLGATWVEVSFLSMVLSTVKIVLIPVLFGIVLNRLFTRQMDTVRDVLPLISVTAIVIIIAGIVGANASKIASCGFLVLIIVMLHNLIGLLLGLGIGRLTHLDYKKPLHLQLKSVCRTVDLPPLWQPLILPCIHWLHFPEQSSVSGIISPVPSLQASADGQRMMQKNLYMRMLISQHSIIRIT